VLALVLVVGGYTCSHRKPGPEVHRAQLRVRDLTTCGMARDGCPEDIQHLYDEEPTVELVTMGIGSLIWERHGHIAMCVRWHDQVKDICFNYGIGSFEKPMSMAWGFFRGTNSFWAGEQPVSTLVSVYAGRNRTVWVQPLKLTAEQKDKVVAALYRDTAPYDDQIVEVRRGWRPEKYRNAQNLYYAYDHFDDNCTTRVRDILDDATGGSLRKLEVETDGKSFRELARDGFYGLEIGGLPLPLLITDIAMGRSTDRVPSYWERMFLPQYLREAVEKVSWGTKPIIVYQRDPAREYPALAGDPGVLKDADGNGLSDAEEDRDHASGRLMLALILLLLASPAALTRYYGRFQRTGMAFALVPQFLLGGILWFLAIISPLPYVMWNESLLLLFPPDILLLFLPAAKRRLYARGRVAMLGLYVLLSLVGILKQPNLALVVWPLIPSFVVGFWREEWSLPSLPAQKLVPCPDCKKDVSSRAAKCPSCGAPLS